MSVTNWYGNNLKFVTRDFEFVDCFFVEFTHGNCGGAFNDDEFFQQYSVHKTVQDEVLKNADVVFLHTPLLPETEYMINDKTLALMKPTAYLINTSRGGLIDEDALYRALKNNVIAGAGTDVFSKEPPDEHPLLELENFVLAPHTAAYTEEAIARCVKMSTQNLIDMLFS